MKKIALVEDNPDNRLLFSTILQDHYELIEYPSGEEAARAIPQYAPDTLMKGGIEYEYKDKVKAQLSGTFADDHFGDDGNTDQRIIPSYKVWDLTAEVKVYKDTVSIFGGINNLFDEHYFARVTATGIDPADGRNYYGGVKVLWR
jgi:outer membrane receptor protein involved in Fe transport